MLRYQSALPHLPVPTLSSTASKYLESVEPHLTPTAYKHTQSVVRDFIGSPLPQELQRRLETRAANTESWLSDWWNEAAYMGYRDPVVVFVSYFFVHADDRLRGDAVSRAASLISAMLPFRDLVESGQLEPEKVRGTTPLCMSSYKYLFHSSRYPVKPIDTAHKFDPLKHNHIIVLRKNKFYLLPLTSGATQLTYAQLRVQLDHVVNAAGSTPHSVPIGALTSDNRDKWAEARETLLAASPENAKTLEAIESAMIIVNLDDCSPATREDASWNAWVGDGRNRWFDKHQLIVTENGKSAFLGEHSCMDGTPTLRMNEFLLASIALDKVPLDPASSSATPLTPPVELKFVLTDDVKCLVKDAESRFDALVGAHDLKVLHYTAYGASHIKTHRCSPDAWAQLVKQLAFYKMFGRPGVTYESAQTRKFALGRTEVIRSASKESKAWVDAMVDAAQTDATRAMLFRQAVTRHLQYASWAADGQGVDRHLFGLKKLLKDGEETPEIYKDEAFGKTSHWEMSTSQLSSQWFEGWGYGEVVSDGYGLAYAIGPDYLRWTITSRKRDTAVFKRYLEEAADEVRAMMDRARDVGGEKEKVKL